MTMIHQIGFGTARELFSSKQGNLETEVENKLLLVKLTKPKTQTSGRPTCIAGCIFFSFHCIL